MALFLSGLVDDQTRTWALDQPLMGIGRSSRNAIHLPDPSVSRDHAEVAVSDGRIELRDLGSRNGVRVNGTRVQAPVALSAGDRVEIGAFMLHVSEGQPTQSVKLLDATMMGTSLRMRADELLQKRANDTASGGRAPIVQFLAQAGQMLVVPRPLQETCDELLEVVARAVPGSRHVLLLHEQPDDEPVAIASRVEGGRSDRPLVLSRTILRHVEETCAAVMTREASQDPRFQGNQSVVMSAARSAMAVPLFDNQKVLGVLYVDSVDARTTFDESQLEVLTLLANMAAVKITNARLLEAEQVRLRLEHELASATQIQRGLLPARLPDVPGWEIDAHLETCYEVGGDLYDVRLHPDGGALFVIGDVSGKGMPASLLMSSFISSLRVLDDTGMEPVTLANRLGVATARSSSDSGRFVTGTIGQLDPASGRARLVNAGHLPTYVIRAGGIEAFESTGIPFGIMSDFSYNDQLIDIAPGETLVLFTDGIPEATRDETFFEEERFREVLLANAGAPLRQVRIAVMAAVEAFLAGAKRTDDITLLLLRRTA